LWVLSLGYVLLLAGSLGQGCKAHIKTLHKQYDTAAQKHARQFGKALGLTASDLLWGLGTVCSVPAAVLHLCLCYSKLCLPQQAWKTSYNASPAERSGASGQEHQIASEAWSQIGSNMFAGAL